MTSLMTTFRQFMGILVALALIFFLLKPFIQTHKQMEDLTFQVHWRWLIPSLGFLLIYRTLYTYPFAILLRGITQKQLPFRTTFTLFHLANITRYLPGRIWGIVRLVSLSQQFGLSKTVVGSSFTLHVGTETTFGGLLATLLIFSQQTRNTAQVILKEGIGHSQFFIFVGLGFLTGILFLIPTLSTHARQFLKTLRYTGLPLFQKSFRCQWLNVIASHILLWCCQGLAFFLFVKSLVSVPWTYVGILMANYAFAWIVGFLSFLAPGGLGVREGLLSVLLASYMPISQATLVALFYRVWMLSTEIILAGLALFLYKKRG